MARIITGLLLALLTLLLGIMDGWLSAAWSVLLELIPIVLVVASIGAWVHVTDRRRAVAARRQHRTGPWV